jgi:hypothetical protein
LDKVAISIPASPQYLQVVRLIAAGLASRLGFTIDEIEDLKIGVDEMCAYLTGTQGREGELKISFEVDGSNLGITGSADLAPGQKVRTELTELSQMILSTVVDEARLEQSNGVPGFTISKTKSE